MLKWVSNRGGLFSHVEIDLRYNVVEFDGCFLCRNACQNGVCQNWYRFHIVVFAVDFDKVKLVCQNRYCLEVCRLWAYVIMSNLMLSSVLSNLMVKFYVKMHVEFVSVKIDVDFVSSKLMSIFAVDFDKFKLVCRNGY